MARAVTFKDGRPVSMTDQRPDWRSHRYRPFPKVPASTLVGVTNRASGVTSNGPDAVSKEWKRPARSRPRTPAPYVPTIHAAPTGTTAVIQLCLRLEVA